VKTEKKELFPTDSKCIELELIACIRCWI